jgi:hypothetical protein
VESIRSLTTRGELPSLSHLLELTHAVGSQAERTAAEAGRSRKADDAAVRALIESGLLKVLQPTRFGGSESGFPGFVRICLAYPAGLDGSRPGRSGLLSSPTSNRPLHNG